MELLLYTLRTVSYAIVEPSHLLILVVLGLVFYTKNKRISMMQKMTIGESLNSPLELTLSQIVLGIIAGAVGSVILSTLGIVFNKNSGIELIFMFSLLLLFVKKRFVCFSYSGAILGLLSIIFTLVSTKLNMQSYINVNIVSLMSFVGVLHIVEGFLVIFDGGRGALPVFSNRNGKIVGGFAFNRYWALPVAIFIALSGTVPSETITSTIQTPGWWPIINKLETSKLLLTMVVSAIPLYGVIGYNSVTFTKEKKKKTLYSGIGILIYGISLVIISQIANLGVIGQIIVVIYAPLGHEFMIKTLNKLEEKGSYIYVSDEEGIAILEVSPTSPAYEAGIRRGDKIIKINDNKVFSEVEIFETVRDSIYDISLVVKSTSGEILERKIKPRNKKIGILLVPKMVKREDALDINNDDFKKILDDLKRKH
ncbi:PDZ domain-containing protein [Clostridium septicum]|uniref:PDZ domain-containing protein n=1 Tax=Clostridium septicum TaxID=1504 RepID=A0A9N7PL37_CLOSE|nr:PDZ domain-containing protein [Clostridium septicum]AYE34141.1 signal protein PDZ [Clostridium septicum]MDU1313060.1 site-2 protease family protein [Clostridium septicum]QAS59509.1 signal protein PDZ [Clostridium septicum]UEC21230.1 PDZ domain-containing protein [Clostridium septicum]USS00724.1 PDZ domain-containing protein [Clostridium septicum]